MEKKPIDPSLTVHVNNDELEGMIDTYRNANVPENLSKLIQKLVTCRILVPAMADPKINKPNPCLLKGPNEQMFLPIFTSLKHTQKAPKSPAILNMQYLQANAFVLNAKEEIAGIVINPFTENLVFSKELIELAKQKTPRQVKLTEEQYMALERVKFEKQFLPRCMFEQGDAFFAKLEQKKEALLDELFEESYEQKRMYPYLEEDFSLMRLKISEDLTVVRIEFPQKDMGPGIAIRGFLTWNYKTKEGHYFLIENGNTPINPQFSEVTRELKCINYGEAPVDGTELQRVLDLVQPSQGMTS